MRVPGRKIYRALPELDGFTDEQCSRFVRAATRTRWWFAIRFVMWGGWIALIGAFSLAGWFTITGAGQPRLAMWAVARPFTATVLLAAVLLSGPALLIARDRLLRWRIGLLLRTRGRCLKCGYGLLGLPVDEELRVRCPECGATTVVDASLGELVRDEQGSARFQPGATPGSAPRGFWTPRRAKLAIRMMAASIVLIVGGPLLTFGIREIWMLWDARAASADRSAIRLKWQALIEAAQPASAAKNGEDAWAYFADVSLEYDLQFRALMQRDEANHPPGAVPLVDLVYHTPRYLVGTDDNVIAQYWREQQERDARSRKLALELLEILRSSGQFDKLDRMVAAPRAVFSVDEDPALPLRGLALPQLGKLRAIARVNRARMQLAAESGDKKEFERAAESNWALARMAQAGPLVICQLVGQAIATLTDAGCREAMCQEPKTIEAGPLLAARRRQLRGMPLSHALEGERLIALDTVAWLFSEPRRVRFGMGSAAVTQFLQTAQADQASGEVFIGGYGASRALIDEYFDEAMARAASKGREKLAAKVDLTRSTLVHELLFDLDNVFVADDRAEVASVGTEAVLRIEEFRARKGRLPESLAEVEAEGEGPLRAPRSGEQWTYTRIQSREQVLAMVPEEFRTQVERAGYLLLLPNPRSNPTTVQPGTWTALGSNTDKSDSAGMILCTPTKSSD